MADHYETLGVGPSATPAEVRAAYLRRARALHPDRQQGRSAEDAGRAERAMRQVNEAWRVLGDAGRRRAYDDARTPHRAPPGATAASPPPGWTGYVTVEDVASEHEASLGTHVVRLLPWAVLAVLGLGIFVFSAVAGGPSDDAPRTTVATAPPGAECLSIDFRARSVTEVACSQPNDGRIDELLTDGGTCPGGTTRIPLADRPEVVCLPAFEDAGSG